MLRVSRKLRFALDAVVDIAYYGGDKPVQSREIANRQGIPHRYLELVMQRLVHNGILRGVRGPHGGYLLARERRRISIGEIARTVSQLEGNDDDDQPEHLSPLGEKVLNPFWDDLQRDVVTRLDRVTIEDLCCRAQEAGVESGARARFDFAI